MEASYTAEGAKGLAHEGGSSRRKTIVLMTAEEMDQAAKKTVAYRPPGK